MRGKEIPCTGKKGSVISIVSMNQADTEKTQQITRYSGHLFPLKQNMDVFY